jgi:hypothetical protein
MTKIWEPSGGQNTFSYRPGYFSFCLNSSLLRPSYFGAPENMGFKKPTGAGDVDQWPSICLACMKPWVPSSALKKKRKTDEQNELNRTNFPIQQL